MGKLEFMILWLPTCQDYTCVAPYQTIGLYSKLLSEKVSLAEGWKGSGSKVKPSFEEVYS